MPSSFSASPVPTDLLLSVILDRSGSMESVRDATIAGVNELLRSQKEEEGRTYVSVTLFNTETELRHVMEPLSDVPLLDRETYRPDGWTALYDAIGDTVKAIEEAQARGTELPERIMLAVVTDGHENSSARFSQKDIFDLVKRKQAEGWAFMFLGCDIDAYDAGAKIGVGVQNTVNYHAAQTYDTYTLVSNTASNYRAGNVSAQNLTGQPTTAKKAVPGPLAAAPPDPQKPAPQTPPDQG